MNFLNFLKESREKYIIEDLSELDNLESQMEEAQMQAKPLSESDLEDIDHIFAGLDAEKVVVVLDDPEDNLCPAGSKRIIPVGDKHLALKVANIEDVINENNLSLCHRIMTDNNVRILENLIEHCTYEVDVKPLKEIRNKIEIKTLNENILITRLNQIISSIETHNQKLDVSNIKSDMAAKERTFMEMISIRDQEKAVQDQIIQTLSKTIQYHDIDIKNQKSNNENLKLGLYIGGCLVFFGAYGVGSTLLVIYTGGLALPVVAMTFTELLGILGIGLGAGIGAGALTGGIGTAIVKLTK